MSSAHKQSLLISPGASLEWIQTNTFRKKYQLQMNGETVGMLYFPKLFSSQARGESGDECWVFRQAGFWRGRIEIRECDHELSTAVFHRKRFRDSGTLHLSKGLLVNLKANIWGSQAEVTTDKGESILTLKSRGIVRDRGSIEFHEKANEYSEMTLILFLTLYVIILQRRRHRH